MIQHIHQCRACRGSLETLFGFNEPIYPSLFTDTPTPPDGWPKVPLHLARCAQCNLVQLEHGFEPDEMYRQYWYKSALNSSMVEALVDVARHGAFYSRLSAGDTVIDIGCNDGTLLRQFGDYGVYRIGFDPSRNLANSAQRHCEAFVNDYFGPNPGERKAKLITAIAMFYDLPDPSKFMEAILTWLDPEGVLVIQMTDLYHMMRENAFDNIVHEHLEYWSLNSLLALCRRFGLDVFNVSTNAVNGGSLRAYICRANRREIDLSVGRYLDREAALCENGWSNFAAVVRETCAKLKGFLEQAKLDDKRVCALGASTKGNTLLQVINASPRLIQSIGEVSADKFGKFTVGSGIGISSESEVLATNPDYVLILPWHFATGIAARHPGVNFLVPMPRAHLNGQPL